ncbi:MAG: fibronectin type III domain-containing protein [Nitrospira sp.]|nr:fibronectin type III domain-containing protein [Nitrospira sp.]
MLTLEDLEYSVRFVSRKSNISITYLTLLVLLLMPLAGCSGEGAGGPIISSLSTPTDASTGLDSDLTSDSEVADSDQEKEPIITMTPTPTGVTAHLTWDHPPDFNATGYRVHYGKRLPEEPSSEEPNLEESSSEKPNACSDGESQAVEDPSATITGLEPNTSYFFVIRAFNESESLCSNEFMAVTPSAQS